jgi:hypothetical protein
MKYEHDREWWVDKNLEGRGSGIFEGSMPKYI